MAAPSRKHGSKNRKNKVVIEFDEHARAEYLKGFHKRKLQRKKDARDKKDKILQGERKALRQKIKDLKNTTTFTSKSYAPIPEIEQIAKPEVFDMPDHTVTITDIGKVDFVGKTGLRMGQNTGQVSDDEDTEDHTPAVAHPESKAKNKSLLRELANCSNQLTVEKSRRANKKRDAERRAKDRKIKKKKKTRRGKKK